MRFFALSVVEWAQNDIVVLYQFTFRKEAVMLSLEHQWFFTTSLRYISNYHRTSDLSKQMPSQAEQAALAHCVNCSECESAYRTLYSNANAGKFGHLIVRSLYHVWEKSSPEALLTDGELLKNLTIHVSRCESCSIATYDPRQYTVVSTNAVHRIIGDVANAMFNRALHGDMKVRNLLNFWVGELKDERQRKYTVEVYEHLDESFQKLFILSRAAFEPFDEVELQQEAIAVLVPYKELLKSALGITLLPRDWNSRRKSKA